METLIDKISLMIPVVMKSGDTLRLNVLRDIKDRLFKAKVAIGKDYVLTREDEDKVLLKMVSQLEESIAEFKKGNRMDLVVLHQDQLEIVKEFAPKVASDEEIETLTKEVIKEYLESKDGDYMISMRDMKPIMSEVQKTYPTANGKVISQVIKEMLG